MKIQNKNFKNKSIRKIRFLSMIVVLLFTHSWCKAQYFFENTGNVSLPNAVAMKPNYIAKGYFNNDKHLDIAVTTGAKNQVTVFINKGLGNGFATPVDYGIGSSGINPRFVTTAHLQNGNITDLITANFGSDDISILPGNKNGTFQNAQCFKVGKAPWSVAVGNFDKDPKPDLVVANTGFDSAFNWYCSNYLSVLWNYDHNTGTVSDVTQVEVDNAPKSVVVGKFNKDGLDDIAVANMLSNTVTILIADDKTKKQGAFIKQQTIDLGTGSCPFFLYYMEDFDELFVCNYFTYDVAVYKKDVSGIFSFLKKFPVGMGPVAIDLGYFDGDNVVDMAVLNMSSDNVSILKGIGNGDFEAINNYYLAGNSPHSLVAGDFFDSKKGFAFAGSFNNKNNKNDDLLIADFSNGKIVCMVNQPDGFSGPKSFEVGSSPVFITTAQLNEPVGINYPRKDNFLDLVTVNENSNTVSVLMGDGKGGFNHNFEDVQVGKSPKSLAIGDFDGDNKENDAAVVNYGDKSISILLDKNNDGVLTNVSTIILKEAPTSITVGDFYGNGKKDLAVISLNSVFILKYVSPAKFTEVKQLVFGSNALTTGFKSNAICTFDFDGNKISDIAAADFTSNKVHIWQAVGNNDFKLFDIVTVGANPRFIVSGNFYGDGHDDDLAIANSGDSSVSILRYEKQKFVAEQPIKVGSKPCFIAAGHLQNASETDLAVVNQGGKSISMLKPNGNGEYSEVGRVATGREPSSVVIGNFNKNGIPDMAVTYKYCFFVSSKNNCFDPPQPISIPCPGKIGFVTIYNQ